MITVALQNKIHKDKTERQKNKNFLRIWQDKMEIYVSLFYFSIVVILFIFFYSFSSKDSMRPGGAIRKYLIGSYKISQNNFLCHIKRF